MNATLASAPTSDDRPLDATGSPGAPPQVSVLMPVYNGERYLRAAMDSVLNQTFTDFEFIIIDDGSTDDTRDILAEYAARDARIRLAHNETNLGITASLNKGLRLARGGFVARQDADDLSLPERLARQVALLRAHPEAVLVSCDFTVIDAEDRPVFQTRRAADPDVIAWFLLFYNRLGGHSQVVFRREAVLRLQGYSPAFRHNEDYDLWVRLSQIGQVVVVPDVLLQWRQHDGSISNRKRAEQELQSLRVSQHALAKYTGIELDLEPVKALRDFWISAFPEAQQVHLVHVWLQEIYHAYLAYQARRDAPVSRLSRDLASRIGRQFSRWALALLYQGQARAALSIAPYAFAWHPYAFVQVTTQALRRKLGGTALLGRPSA